MADDDGAHESRAAGNESEASPPEKRSGCHGPFIIDAGGAETAWPLLAGGQLF